VLETWFIQLVFLIPGITGAIGTFAELASGRDISQFPTFVHGQPVLNLVLGVVTYTAVLVPVPIALLLLARTGQPPTSLGLGRPRFRADLLPAAGLALGGYAIAFGLGVVLAPLLANLSNLVQQVPIGDVPRYYIVYALLLSAMTAIAEETLVSGYLLTRLEQLGWTPQRALILSLVLRTSYHVYYGVGLIFTIPVGYLLTRSFQKHRRLNRPIVAHFLYDAVLLTLSILFVS
jgi:membrane protease YdiL (CAAX protease family)